MNILSAMAVRKLYTAEAVLFSMGLAPSRSNLKFVRTGLLALRRAGAVRSSFAGHDVVYSKK